MKIYIKNMVCNRCITAVTEQFLKQGVKPEDVRLGEVQIEKVKSTWQDSVISLLNGFRYRHIMIPTWD